MDEAQKDNRSEIHRHFDRIASRCVEPLLKVSDSGEVLCPHHISEVAELIVKELGNLHFLGIPERKSPADSS